jgi:AcrR family transcriptional regulator
VFFVRQKGLSSATRTAILDAANRVIIKKGADSLTLDAVAHEAGISKGGLLYHFASKRSLIEAMLDRQIAAIDSLFEEELGKEGGDFVTAYIRASFVTDPNRTRISQAMIAAVAHDPELIKPLQARFAKMQKALSSAAVTPEIGTIIRLALDGLWISDLFGFAPPSAALREKMQRAILRIADFKRAP